MILQKDDWELTLKEFKSQRVQILLNKEVNETVIKMLEEKIKNYGTTKEPKV